MRGCFSPNSAHAAIKAQPLPRLSATELFHHELYPVAGFHRVEDAEAPEIAIRRGHAGRQAFDRVIRPEGDDPQVQRLCSSQYMLTTMP
jgi:hypothetical protein